MILISTLCCTVIAVLLLIKIYFKNKFSYWSNRNIPTLAPSIPFGNIPNPISKTRKNIGVIIAEIYHEMKLKGWQDGGIYFLGRPNYMPLNLDYIKHVLSKDFNHFVERGILGSKEEPLTNSLFLIGGARWRSMRSKLTPTFTSGKLRGMFSIFTECGEKLSKSVNTEKEVDIKQVLECYTTDIIGSCAFGLECDSFQDENAPFRQMVRKFFGNSFWLTFSRAIYVNFPLVARQFGFKFVPVDVTKFFFQIVEETATLRKNASNKRMDFFQLLLDLKEEGQLDMIEVTAQAFLFFVAGFETSSTTMSFALYEMAKNYSIQQRVRDELKQVLGKHSELTYEALKELCYLNQVIEETMRKYPPVPFITRKCNKEYRHPFKEDGFLIEEGTRVVIPILGIHRDEEYYPNADEFKPERFSQTEKEKRHPYAYLPFGEGPRMCIGIRFGMMQMKVGLVNLMRNFEFTINSKTIEPITFSNNSMVMAAVGGIWLDVKKNKLV